MIAPRVAQLVDRLDEGGDAVFYDPGDVQGLAEVLRSIASDPKRRRRLAAGAGAAAAAWSWDRQVARVGAALAAQRG